MSKQQTKKVLTRRIIKLTKKQKTELLRAEKKITKPQVLKKIQCVQLKAKGWTHKEAAEHLNVGISTVSTWIKTYKEQGVKQLTTWNYSGKPSKLSEGHIRQLKARVKDEPFDVAQEALDYIKAEFNIKYNVRYLPRLLKKTNCHTKSLVPSPAIIQSRKYKKNLSGPIAVII